MVVFKDDLFPLKTALKTFIIAKNARKSGNYLDKHSLEHVGDQ